MYTKMKLILSILMLTAIVFSCEKANVSPQESQDNNITATSKKGIAGPSIHANFDAICTGRIFGGEQRGTTQGVGIGNDYNTIKVTLDSQTASFYSPPFNYKIYNSSGVLVKDITLYPSPVVYLSGLGNNSVYTVVISKGSIWYDFSGITTLDCVPSE